MGLYHLFKQQVVQDPDAAALIYKDSKTTYQELSNSVDALADTIIANTPKADVVGISASRSAHTIIGIMALIKAGKTYLPLDASYPADRLKNIIEDSGIDTVLAAEDEQDLFSELGLEVIATDMEYGDEEFEDFPATGDPGYVLYTSGSTGKPKGVRMGGTALVNLLNWQKKHSASAPGFNTLQYAPLTFDVSFQEIFATLTTGGTLFLIADEARLDPSELIRFIDTHSINRIFLPFVALQYLAEAADSYTFANASLQEVMTAGEQLKITPQIVKLFQSLPQCKLFNQYGPTESHVVTQLELTGDPQSWPALPSIGKPIDNTGILILNEQLQPVADGETGELFISGICLADGYLNNPDLTAERFFVADINGDAKRVYKSGDIARVLPDGNIDYLGRTDTQVKIRGNRVEPAEIEVLLNQAPGIQQAVVVAKAYHGDSKRLIAYLISDGGEDTAAIKHYIADKVPDYMVPSAFIWVQDFPQTSSGKIDRNALPNPVLQRPDGAVLYSAPATLTQKRLAEIWADMLLIDRIGIDDNFFDLGGNSLLAINTATRLRSQYGIALPVTKIYQYPTIAGIASAIDGSDQPGIAVSNKKEKHSNGNIAIIGMAGKWPGAETVAEFWDNLKNGIETTSFFSKDELDLNIPDKIKNDPAYVKARGVLKDPGAFDAGFFSIVPRLAQLMDPQQRVFLEIAYEALESAGHLPQHFKGLVGVYAGTNNNTYYYNNVLTNSDQVSSAGAFQVMTLNEKDYVATRTAYELNLKGPAVSVYSACSTSLLAVAQAVDALRDGQCDVALAGGVTISSPVKSGHLYQEDAMLSKDGHTRTFDAQATGTVFSDGAGVVLLKPLAAAEADGDTIYAVIKGKGVNNDGHSKGSFSAPSVSGQAGAIRSAIQDAGVEPSDISYIEAHGTATPLGDPIEIDGLKMAFGKTEEKQYCAIGSVKSNFGHLTAAAGVTGLIKTSLSLYNKQLIPTLNFSEPNPAIDFVDSPFYVNTELKDWDSKGTRTAGISSFGVGGTNVHVVLQSHEHEAQPSGPSHPAQLFTFSARTKTSLDNYALKLAAHPIGDLADAAYSLQTTRGLFNERRFEVATDRADLQNKLRDPKSLRQKTLREKATEVVFLFPGQGSQFAGMGKTFYDAEPVFRDAVDECAEIIRKHVGIDIVDVLYGEDSKELLSIALYIQPAIFVIEYATAKLWMSWGIKPAAFLGHSLGEFASAHLSGIMSLEDTLMLLTARAQMIHDLPHGKMLAVRLTADELKEVLPENLSIAAHNSPKLNVVSGQTELVEAFADLLAEEGIASMALNTSHAMHSAMVDPIVGPFRDLVATVKLSPPRIPVISSMTGKWLSEADALDPNYWATQMREPVAFVGALQTANDEPNRLMLECGPGNILSNLAKGQVDRTKEQLILPGLTDNVELSYITILNSLGYLWLYGIEFAPALLYAGQQRRRIPLPSYAFDHQNYWIAPGKLTSSPAAEIVETPTETKETPTPAPLMRTVLLSQKIKEIFEDASGIAMDTVPDNMTFAEAGFDSLLLTQIALQLKKEFSVPVTFRRMYEEYNTVELLAQHLDAALPAGAYASAPAVAPVVTAAIPSVGQSPLDLITQQMQALAQQVAMLQNANTAAAPVAVPAPQPGITLRPEADLSPEEQIEVKKPFGATARIERQGTDLSDEQKAFISNLTITYNSRTKSSKAYTQKHRDGMADPRVVSGFRPQTKELVYPLVVDRSQGSRVWDIDGNEYVDALNGFGSNFLGYNPPFLKQIFLDQIERGYEIGPQHILAGEVSELINEFTGFERSALCNTGSEAVLGAMRMARTVSGRSLIVAFAGSYHGIIDEVIIRGSKKLRSIPAAPGILPEAVQNMLILDYGTDESLAIIKQRAHEIAAVMVEPVQSRRPEFQPVEFLKQLRQVTKDADVALIFDEVITGFRMHPGGAQALFGIKADIGTYGKVIGGGMPIGVIAGIPQYMDALDGGTWQYGDASVPEAGVTYFAGTFVRHPLALAGAKAVLTHLKEQGPELQQNINTLAKTLADSLNEICERYELPVYIAQFGSLWKIKFKYEMPYGELLFTLMRHKGIHIWDIFPCFLTAAHTIDDVEMIIEKFEESVTDMMVGGFFAAPTSKNDTPAKPVVTDQAPAPEARLGRDRDGNPAWFIPDKDNPGKYLQIQK
ncbi:polyketide synthase [Mucilaginibacter myungsuensis]|uniref:Amino acid adenylation domain-containing protein n=1 Tax=Mucilaginibacter myungsuensis TaxID=649104 RepID=A0A929L3H8_9SPHI|nr:polyketide synthase [Mucilaginibacter myungsuensis]MBE9663375.1 amino acid adenylation domain-containing protein [Mucilaginibacter myungsuensis]MDN3600112.1 amino acid adenylation domain-containing protein [Mucilaginibacter myungsuensis]